MAKFKINDRVIYLFNKKSVSYKKPGTITSQYIGCDNQVICILAFDSGDIKHVWEGYLILENEWRIKNIIE